MLKKIEMAACFMSFFQVCNLCDYRNPNSDKVARHLALGHSKIDELLRNAPLLEHKRQVAKLKRKRETPNVNTIPRCPICDLRDVHRDHVAMHFVDELKQYVTLAMPNSPTQCVTCHVRIADPTNMAIHVATSHGT